jgi:uncharacterized protein YutE (UPF0331/DUF86 family)
MTDPLQPPSLEQLLDYVDVVVEHLAEIATLPPDEFLAFEELRLAAEDGLENAAQACVHIADQVIARAGRSIAGSDTRALEALEDLDVLPGDFARSFASIVAFRYALASEEIALDWEVVYLNLQRVGEIGQFVQYVREWLERTPEFAP